MNICLLVTFQSSLLDTPLRTVGHRTEKLPNKAVSTHEIINKTEEGADKATGSCDYTELAGFAYCQLADSR